jgi:hypothetical protein
MNQHAQHQCRLNTSLSTCRPSQGKPLPYSLSTWTRRYCPIILAGTERHAAELAYRYLAGQITEGQRIVKTVASGIPATSHQPQEQHHD